MTIQISHTDLRILLGALVVLVLLLARLPRLRRMETLAYGLAGLIGFAAFFNFGLQYQQRSVGFLNRWDLYHYQLGAKYFPELGYDGLYAASLLAQHQSAPELPVRPLRDLRTNALVAAKDHEATIGAVRARFSDPRWREFVADHDQYVAHTTPAFWKVVRQDHGYNPTPAWTFVARLFAARLGASDTALGFLASLDLALLAAMFAVVFRTYGFSTGCLALAIAGLGFGWRFIYLGALLRLDWLATAVIGICMLKRERFATAGGCFAYAAAVRVFPLALVLGPGLIAIRSWLAGERPRWPLRFAAGFGAVACLAVVGGAATGHGFRAWSDFAADIQVHRESFGTNQVGLDTLFLAGPSYVLAGFRETPPRRARQQVADALAARRVPRVLAAGLLLGLIGLAAWGAALADAAALALAAVFVLTPASYYWILAVAVPLRGSRWAPLALLALYTTMYALSRVFYADDHHPWLYALLSWGTAGVLVAWLLPDAIRQLRSRFGQLPPVP